MATIKNKRQAIKADLGIFYQKMLEFLSQNENHERPGISLGIKLKPILDCGINSVTVGLQTDCIGRVGIERLPKPWLYIRTDNGEQDRTHRGEQLLEVTWDRNQISGNQ